MKMASLTSMAAMICLSALATVQMADAGQSVLIGGWDEGKEAAYGRVEIRRAQH
jgi:hypothetical protein